MGTFAHKNSRKMNKDYKKTVKIWKWLAVFAVFGYFKAFLKSKFLISPTQKNMKNSTKIVKHGRNLIFGGICRPFFEQKLN